MTHAGGWPEERFECPTERSPSAWPRAYFDFACMFYTGWCGSALRVQFYLDEVGSPWLFCQWLLLICLYTDNACQCSMLLLWVPGWVCTPCSTIIWCVTLTMDLCMFPAVAPLTAVAESRGAGVGHCLHLPRLCQAALGTTGFIAAPESPYGVQLWHHGGRGSLEPSLRLPVPWHDVQPKHAPGRHPP